jgi:hypothetical protein
MIVVHIFALGLVLFLIANGTAFDPYGWGYFILLVILMIPISNYFKIKEMYKSNKVLHEQVSYSLTQNNIIIKGETFDSTLTWSHFTAIQETKQFFLLYQNPQIVTLLDKKMFQEMDLIEFKKFLLSLPIPRV